MNDVDRQLFRVSTIVTIGNGEKAEFWEASWLQGRASRDIAPSLYKLAWRKHLKVKDQLLNQSWTRGLWRMSTVEEMAEFVALWDLVQNVQLTSEEDQIQWKWSADGMYSAKSAYEVQFKGSFCSFRPNHIWRAHAEGKHKFFTWLLVQEKLLTADKQQARNWPCNPVCSLCSNHPETATHLCLHCPFAVEVWGLVSNWFGGVVFVPAQELSIKDWWCEAITQQPKPKRRWQPYSCTQCGTYGRREIGEFLKGKAVEPGLVLHLIKEEVQLRFRAWCPRCTLVSHVS